MVPTPDPGSDPDRLVPVSEGCFQELRTLKEPGQTYDELLGAMLEEYRKSRLFAHLDEIRSESAFEPLATDVD